MHDEHGVDDVVEVLVRQKDADVVHDHLFDSLAGRRTASAGMPQQAKLSDRNTPTLMVAQKP